MPDPISTRIAVVLLAEIMVRRGSPQISREAGEVYNRLMEPEPTQASGKWSLADVGITPQGTVLPSARDEEDPDAALLRVANWLDTNAARPDLCETVMGARTALLSARNDVVIMGKLLAKERGSDGR